MAHFVTGKVRLSYVHLTTPDVDPATGKEKYKVTILIPKTDTATKAKLDQAIKAAAEEGKVKKFGGVIPNPINTPVHDGDGAKPNGGAYSEECKGHWVLNASSTTRPSIVNLALEPIMDASEIYSGVYARCGLDIYPYAATGRRGLACGISNVQKIADGEPLSGRVSAADDFGGDNAIDPMFAI